jgi:aldehyde dehydrogenase (NAD(P)+)
VHPVPDSAALIRLLDACIERTIDAAEAWSEAGLAAKGLPSHHPEEWLTGPTPVVRQLRLLRETLVRVHQGRPTLGPHRMTVDGEGSTWVRVVPSAPQDELLFRGFVAELMMEDGIGPTEVLDRAARPHRGSAPEGVCAVLGAGNVSSIPALDALSKVVGDRRPTVVKTSPVNEWVRPHLEAALAPFIEAGHLSFVSGGVDEAQELIARDDVTQVHVTGSLATHHRIVFGGDDGRRDRGEPVLSKEVTSELGNVSPVAIVPGPYTEAELDFLAQYVVAMVTNNAGYNCNAARVVLVAPGWHQQEALLHRVRAGFEATPIRDAYYPGSDATYEALMQGRDPIRIGRAGRGQLPWTLLRDLKPDDVFFREEHFIPVLGWHEIPSADSVDFLDRAVSFMNEHLWGTLNAMVVVPRSMMAVPAVHRALDRAVRKLDYGTVGINHWPALGYAWAAPPWGGAPGRTLSDPQSGIGWVHNACLVDGVRKVVIRGPFPTWPKPVWFPGHRGAAEAGRRLVRHEGRSSWWTAVRVAVPGALG